MTSTTSAFSAILIIFSVFTGVSASPAIAADFSASAAVRAINAIRAKHRLPKLALEPRLQRAAREQAILMARKGKMSHTAGWGNSFGSRMKRVGYRGFAAENIASGQRNLEATLRAWMNSRGHRKNMLHPRARYFGLSVAAARDRRRGGKRTYWALVLGG